MIFQQMSDIISCCHTFIPTRPYEGQRQTVVRTVRLLLPSGTQHLKDRTCLLRMLQKDFMLVQRDAGRR
jgi:hypothetical protein